MWEGCLQPPRFDAIIKKSIGGFVTVGNSAVRLEKQSSDKQGGKEKLMTI